MDDNSKHALPQTDPMFESICAAMEEAEKSWGSVSEFEASVSERFKDVMNRSWPRQLGNRATEIEENKTPHQLHRSSNRL